MTQKYTKEKITEMADRCYRRCWRCERYEPCSGIGSGGPYLFSYAGSGCYESYNLPWEQGHWCPFWGNKNHPDAEILRSLTWNNVAQYTFAEHLYTPNELRTKILAANPKIAETCKYVDNSNNERDQYFNKPENHAILHFNNFDVYCETLRRYRFSHVDNRMLYPGANEWIRPMMIAYDPKTYKSLCAYYGSVDGTQISFACSPDENYILNTEIFFFNEETKEMVAELRNRDKIVKTVRMSLANLNPTR